MMALNVFDVEDAQIACGAVPLDARRVSRHGSSSTRQPLDLVADFLRLLLLSVADDRLDYAGRCSDGYCNANLLVLSITFSLQDVRPPGLRAGREPLRGR
ncbi:hypothetical protein HNR03_000232 [Pseudomonas sp. JAI111]|nr:hypothetical protein [Pseudomonas sp. JAI111]